MNCKCPYCDKIFDNWNSVRKHIATCKYNITNEYYIDLNYGPISIYEFIELEDQYFIKSKYPNLSSSLGDIGISFRRRGYKFNFCRKWTKILVINAIKKYHKEFNKIPEFRDWNSDIVLSGYPSTGAVRRLFGSWNEGIKAAGFEPNIQNGFGIDTFGKDGHLYRSSCEAYFADNYLFGKYEYEIEPKYPDPYNKYYDWYIPRLNLYIELDGECRPDVIKEKILINKQLRRNLKVIKTTEIYNKQLILP